MKLINWRTLKEIFFSVEWRVSNREGMFYSTALWVISIWIRLWLTLIQNKIIWINDANSSGYIYFIWLTLFILWLGVSVLYLIMNIFLDIKRCHDHWRKWSRLLCLLIPFYNIWVWVELIFFPWQDAENQYWKKVRDVSLIIKVIGVVWTICTILYEMYNIAKTSALF